MAVYFDLSVQAVRNMLPSSIECRDDLEFLTAEAEAEIIQHYTREELDTRGTAVSTGVVTGNENLTTSSSDPVVYLRYYKVDADSLTSTSELAFKTAMRRAIAALVRLRAPQEDLDPLVKSETRGRRSVTYWDGANRIGGSIPKSVTKWLKAYDKRPVSFAI